MDPSPSPSPSGTLTPLIDEAAARAIEYTAVAVIIGVVVGSVAVVVFSALLVKSASYPMPVPIIAPLAMLSLVALLIGGLANVPALIPLGATGIGALAAVVTAQLGKPNDPGGPDDNNEEA
ncbi:MAG: hypothetical protein ACO28P_01400 [Ilumatobacteraceae bacterium]